LTRPRRPDSEIEALFALQWRALKLPPAYRDFRPLEGRKLELDFAWPAIRFAVEIDGAVHRITERFHADCEKHALCALAGWQVLRLTGRHIRAGHGITWAAELYARRLKENTK